MNAWQIAAFRIWLAVNPQARGVIRWWLARPWLVSEYLERAA